MPTATTVHGPNLTPSACRSILQTPLTACLALLAAWLADRRRGPARPRSVRFAGRTLFPLGALVGIGARRRPAMRVSRCPAEQAGAADRPARPADAPAPRRAVERLPVAARRRFGRISIFAAGYFRRGEGTPPGLLCLQYHLFLASMGFVLLADDAYAFMVAWETMALSSYFLVTTQHRIPEIRRAGFLYLLIAHVGAIAILLCFGVMQGGSWQFTFDAMRAAQPRSEWARSRSCWRCSASAPRRAWCRCMSGCPKPTLPRRRRFRR